ncbi:MULTISPECIES: DUF2786 domain-containing protein [unclassified Streptococcus]|uniref:DUF2786 domain-containing protein n=1 Tax=unclassified Streptococcus TaxID=2608887 RepID=UPI001071EB5A|nr:MULTISPECIES: DUF2786 domain-containing protein [unclassified Streptococcus]MBF0786969.1 DUF2786 domain-containing protein [Streptococcus sp. 19428wC2_LYSM12]MCQ9211513.1 DUF2786 domain-containing protein [Streptococcus sp. B01]MCQ9214829.1 DUF2786 domain-containing protein [Streptococcus sp. O1]TFV06168.1 DUF2786 domain-containing protein [Streptococcus sp. LYSM12]
MDNKIISKVQNLLELAYDAPNDEEGQTALLMAQKLMVKHNLSMSDVTTAKTKNNIGETVGTREYRLPWWQEKLAAILGENFRCQTIRRRLPDDGITQIIFFGYHSDAELCTKVYEGAILYLKYRLKRLFPTITKARWKDYKKSYLLGFLDGLDQRFKIQVQSSEEFALMVQIPAEVLEEQRLRMGDLKSRTINIEIEIDSEAYITGLEHAKETRLMPKELLE